MKGRWSKALGAIALTLASFGTMPSVALSAAQPAAAQTVPEGFEPVTEVPPEEQIPAKPLVAGAYAFIWLAMLVYVGLLWRRLGAVQKDIDALRRSQTR